MNVSDNNALIQNSNEQHSENHHTPLLYRDDVDDDDDDTYNTYNTYSTYNNNSPITMTTLTPRNDHQESNFNYNNDNDNKNNNNNKRNSSMMKWCCTYQDPTLLMNYDNDNNNNHWYHNNNEGSSTYHDDLCDEEYDVEQEVFFTERLSSTLSNLSLLSPTTTNSNSKYNNNNNDNDNDNVNSGNSGNNITPTSISSSICSNSLSLALSSSPLLKSISTINNPTGATAATTTTTTTSSCRGSQSKRAKSFWKERISQIVVSFEKPIVTSVKHRPKTKEEDIDGLFYSESDIEGFARECEKEHNLASILKKTLMITQSSSILTMESRSFDCGDDIDIGSYSYSPSLTCKGTLETEPLSDSEAASECQSLQEAGTFETALGEHDTVVTRIDDIPSSTPGEAEEKEQVQVQVHDIYFDANENEG